MKACLQKISLKNIDYDLQDVQVHKPDQKLVRM